MSCLTPNLWKYRDTVFHHYRRWIFLLTLPYCFFQLCTFQLEMSSEVPARWNIRAKKMTESRHTQILSPPPSLPIHDNVRSEAELERPDPEMPLLFNGPLKPKWLTVLFGMEMEDFGRAHHLRYVAEVFISEKTRQFVRWSQHQVGQGAVL